MKLLKYKTILCAVGVGILATGCESAVVVGPDVNPRNDAGTVLTVRPYPAAEASDPEMRILERQYVKGRLLVKLKDGVRNVPLVAPQTGETAPDMEGMRFSRLNSVLANSKPLAGGLHAIDLDAFETVLPLEPSGSAAPRATSTREIVTERIIMDKHGMRTEKIRDMVNIGGEMTSMHDVSAFLSSHRFADEIEYVGREYIHTSVHDVLRPTGVALDSNDSYASLQWHYGPAAQGGAGFTEFWRNSGTGPSEDAKQIVVAVIDTGQIYDHPDLAPENLLPGYDFISYSNNGDGDGRDADPTDPGDGRDAGFCSPNSGASESSWHGSHVSGTIGAAKSNNGRGIASGAWGVKILPIRALGRCGGSSLDIAEAIDWAVLKQDDPLLPPKPERPADIINLSLGGYSETCDPVYQDAINRARAAGAIVVVAAGNSAIDAKNFTPANCEGVITVAASETQSILAPYSNYGETIDIMAPGGDTSADRNGDTYGDGVLSMVKDSYAFYQGTSMAAPHVAAAAALVWGNNPQMSSYQIANYLIYRSRRLENGACRFAAQCGRGHLDISAD